MQHEGKKERLESKLHLHSGSQHYAQLRVMGIFDLQFEMEYTIYDAYKSATQHH